MGAFKAAMAALDRRIRDEVTARRGRLDDGHGVSPLLQARDEDGAPLTDDELRDELVTLVLAGQRRPPPRWPDDGPASPPRSLARAREEARGPRTPPRTWTR